MLSSLESIQEPQPQPTIDSPAPSIFSPTPSETSLGKSESVTSHRKNKSISTQMLPSLVEETEHSSAREEINLKIRHPSQQNSLTDEISNFQSSDSFRHRINLTHSQISSSNCSTRPISYSNSPKSLKNNCLKCEKLKNFYTKKTNRVQFEKDKIISNLEHENNLLHKKLEKCTRKLRVGENLSNKLVDRLGESHFRKFLKCSRQEAGHTILDSEINLGKNRVIERYEKEVKSLKEEIKEVAF